MGRKHLWEKEKLLVMSNFSFSHSVFKRFVSQGHKKVSLCGNGLKNQGDLFEEELGACTWISLYPVVSL